MSDAFIGEIRIFPYNFAPDQWLPCDGTIYAISRFQALFSVIGNTYGGDAGKGTFGVPNLSARSTEANPAICGVGQAFGTSANWVLGQAAGTQSVTLGMNQLPSHTHQMVRTGGSWTAAKKLAAPSGGVQVGGLYVNLTTTGETLTANSPNTTLSPLAIGSVGGSAAHENRQPFLVCPFAICWDGTYPVPA